MSERSVARCGVLEPAAGWEQAGDAVRSRAGQKTGNPPTGNIDSSACSQAFFDSFYHVCSSI